MKTKPSQQAPSTWIAQHAHLIPENGHILDLACGKGRHTRFFLQKGHAVTAVDIDLGGVADLATVPDTTLIEADLENAAWPLAGRQYDAVIVCNYLHRPILNHIFQVVAPGGLLLYDTFAAGNERFGRPRNPAFLLQADELLRLTRDDFVARAYQHGRVDTPRPAIRQSLCAIRTPTNN